MKTELAAPTKQMRANVHAGAVAALSGPEFLVALRHAIDGAQTRIYVLQFVIDARPDEDRYGEVRHLLTALGEAVARGVDVRVIVPVVQALGDQPYDLNDPAARFLCARGVRVDRYAGHAPRPVLHAKLVVIDDLCFVGNCNWTPSAFRLNTELTVVIRSASAAQEAAVRVENIALTHCARCCHDQPKVRRQAQPRSSKADPMHALAAVAPAVASRLDAMATMPSSAPASATVRFLAGQPYVRALVRLIDDAVQRVWVGMFGLRASTSNRLRPLLAALARAHARGVDVRILYDGADERPEMWVDLHTLRDLGIRCRAFGLRSRLHVRTVLVDHADVVMGSVAWTPQSVFLCEELSVRVCNVPFADSVAQLHEQWWDAAGMPPEDWSLDQLDLAPEMLASLHKARVKSTGELIATDRAPGISKQDLRALQNAARWVVHHRVPPAVATLLSRAKVDSLEALRRLRGASRIDAALRPRPRAVSALDLVPAGSYLARFLDSGTKSPHRFVRTTVVRPPPPTSPRIIEVLPRTSYTFSSLSPGTGSVVVPILQNLRCASWGRAMLRVRVHAASMPSAASFRIDANLVAPTTADPKAVFTGPRVASVVVTDVNVVVPSLLEAPLDSLGAAVSFALSVTTGNQGGAFTFTISADLVVRDSVDSWSPAELGSALRLWVDRRDQVVVAGAYSDWGDQSTANNDFTQATSTLRPITGQAINGEPAPDFDGTDDSLGSGALSSFVPLNRYHVFVILRAQTVTGVNAVSYLNNGVIADGGIGWWGLYLRNVFGVPKVLGFHYDTGEKVAIADGLALNTDTMIEWSFDGTTIRCQVAGGPMASIAAGNIGSLADPLRLGRGASSGLTLDGSVASALVVNRYLNASERLAARSYLSSRYGVPS